MAAAFGVRAPRLRERYVPASEAYLRAVEMGWGIGVLPLLQAQPSLESGALRLLHSEITVPVALYWHQWQLALPANETSPRLALLDQVGEALAAGAAQALKPPDPGADGMR